MTAPATEAHALAETTRAPRPLASTTFLSLWRPGRESGPVLEQFSLRDGRPLRQLAAVPEDVLRPQAGPDNSVWLTISTGPRDRNNTDGGDPEPDSCSGSVLRLNLDTGKTHTVLTAASSQKIYDAIPSPDGRLLVMETGSCNGSYLNEHLLVKQLQSGRQWTIGADAAPCHEISTPSWNRSGTELAFVYSSATSSGLPETPRKDLGHGICSAPGPGEVARIPAGHAS
jgi:Tol biopolymer transport system component